MAEKRLTDEEYQRKVDCYKDMDEKTGGVTRYLPNFLEEQDLLERKLNDPNYVEPEMTFEEKEYEEWHNSIGGDGLVDQNLLDKVLRTGKKEPTKKKVTNFLKDVLLFPYNFVVDSFGCYIENMTFVKGIVIFLFALTTVFCGWIAFLKSLYAICMFVSTHTPFMMYSPFESADYFPWITLAVVWLLPFLVHALGKYVIVFIPVVVILLVVIEVLTGNPFFTDMFCDLLDGLAGNL